MPTAVESIFLKLDGIKGESTNKDHEGWIELESFSWGLANMSTVGGAGGGGGAGRTSFQDFHFTKTVDKSSPQLFLSCASGKHLAEGQLSFVKISATDAPTLTTSSEGAADYLKIKLTEVLVSSFMQKCDGLNNDGLPQDSFSLNFSKIEFSVLNQIAEWDLQTHK